MANEIKLLFSLSLSHRAKTEDRGVSLAISGYDGTEISAHRTPRFLVLSFPRSARVCRISSSYAFHASFPADYSKDIGGSFLLEADASAAVAPVALCRAAYK